MDYLKIITELYLRENGIDAEVTTVPIKKNQKETDKKDKTAKVVTAKNEQAER